MTSKMDRRTFLQGTSVAALSTMLPAVADAQMLMPLAAPTRNCHSAFTAIGHQYRFRIWRRISFHRPFFDSRAIWTDWQRVEQRSDLDASDRQQRLPQYQY